MPESGESRDVCILGWNPQSAIKKRHPEVQASCLHWSQPAPLKTPAPDLPGMVNAGFHPERLNQGVPTAVGEGRGAQSNGIHLAYPGIMSVEPEDDGVTPNMGYSGCHHSQEKAESPEAVFSRVAIFESFRDKRGDP